MKYYVITDKETEIGFKYKILLKDITINMMKSNCKVYALMLRLKYVL